MSKKIKTFSVCAVVVGSKFIGHFQEVEPVLTTMAGGDT